MIFNITISDAKHIKKHATKTIKNGKTEYQLPSFYLLKNVSISEYTVRGMKKNYGYGTESIHFYDVNIKSDSARQILFGND